MRTLLSQILVVAVLFTGMSMFAQQRDLENFRPPDQRGLHIFEDPKDSVQEFDGVKVRVGGASTIQFQALDHENSGAVALKEIGNNFNLATANLDLDVQLYTGVRMHLRTYLSSRHHPEPYVKGGYILIDRLDFINEGFLGGLMDNVTLKIGHMENNYGDAHFRRSDNAHTLQNPFVGNLIMDAFTTEVGAELYYRRSGFIGMIGLTNGKLNQSVDVSGDTDTKASFIAKLGYDNFASYDNLRFRLTGSVYSTGEAARTYLYSADRAGSRYYLVMEDEEATTSGNFRSGRFDPGFRNELTAFMINPFLKYGGLEFFGTLEFSSGKANAEASKRNASQYAGEVIYRFGGNDDLFVGARYNAVSAELASGDDVDINRFQFGAGYFLTKNIVAKLEYVNQTYDGYDATSIFNDGKFNGLMLEAAISF
ncbi:hypothetical protein [Robertkochia flava]|uniref:hypothetical protein n=1 Tax=Robertkochia flava TaxID=3447986 RepID=UPI001CCC634B|nr:hypothetical protein [Robertkochia marina]